MIAFFLHACMDFTFQSSDEEVEEGGERKKKKTKGLKEAIKDKLSGDKEGEDRVPMEKCSGGGNAETEQPEEKKGFLETIKDKLPGQHKKGEEEILTPPAAEEKKGIIDKIKERLPGQHKSNENEVEK